MHPGCSIPHKYKIWDFEQMLNLLQDLFLVEEYINAADGVFGCNISGFRIVQMDPLMKVSFKLNCSLTN